MRLLGALLAAALILGSPFLAEPNPHHGHLHQGPGRRFKRGRSEEASSRAAVSEEEVNP